MNTDEAKQLAVGDQVWTDQLPPGERHVGEVVDRSPWLVKVRWDDGETGITHHDDMGQIHRIVASDGR